MCSLGGKNTVLMIYHYCPRMPFGGTVIIFVNDHCSIHEWVNITLTDACALCWRELCSSHFPPGRAGPLCPASWDFWETSSLSVDILDETCCTHTDTHTQQDFTHRSIWRLFSFMWSQSYCPSTTPKSLTPPLKIVNLHVVLTSPLWLVFRWIFLSSGFIIQVQLLWIGSLLQK